MYRLNHTITFAILFALSLNAAPITANASTDAKKIPHPPSLTLSSSAASVDYGSPITLNWSASHVTSCHASGNWTGAKALKGNKNVTHIAQAASYTLTCKGAGGSISQTVDIAVATYPAITILGHVQDNKKQIISGETITVSAQGVNATADPATGKYTLSLTPQSEQIVMTINAAGYAPQIAHFSMKPGVTTFEKQVELTPFVITPIDNNGGSVNVTAPNGHQATFTVPANAINGSGYLRVSSFSAANGPGTLSISQTDALQSSGMFYFDIVDGSDQPIPLNPGYSIQISLPAASGKTIPTAKSYMSYQINPETGVWGGAQPLQAVMASKLRSATALSAAANNQLSADGFGYWNSDRAYKTACVTGIVKTSKGHCTGGQMTGSGPDGLSSSDNVSANGAFCVTGAQTWGSTLSMGGFSTQVTMPSQPGNCSVPSSCKNIGTITVPVKDCTTQPDNQPSVVNGGLNGQFSGGGSGASVSGSFQMNIVNNVVNGSFSGSDSYYGSAFPISGPLTGELQNSGSFSAASGGSTMGTWTGNIVQHSSSLSGSGSWNVTIEGQSYTGSWSGTGATK